MATMQQLEIALRNADAAGDVAAARMFAAEIQRQRAAAPQAAPSVAPQEPLSRMEKISKGMMDPFNGAAQLVTNLLPKSVVEAGNTANNWLADKTGLVAKLPAGGVDQQVRDAEAKYEARRKAQGEEGFDAYRAIGNVASPANLAIALRAPAAATAAGRLGIGAAGGAASGALAPVGEGDYTGEKLKQIAVGGAVGGAVPIATGLASRLAKVLRAGLIDPFTEAGRTRIVGGALNRAAADPVDAAANMSMARGATPGFNPTAGQASGDAGVASLERAARGIDPGGFGQVDTSQRAALANALRKIAGTPEQRAKAVQAREDATNQLYRQADQVSIPVDAELGALMQRPSMQAAMGDARQLAAERGQAAIPDSGPPSLTGENLHDIKLSLDTLFQDPTKGIVGAKRDAAKTTRQEFLDLLAGRIPSYDQARTTFAGMSRPINQQDVGQELYNRLVPAVADVGDSPVSLSAAKYAQALRNGDDLAANVTGMPGARLSKVMEPDQMSAINGVLDDAQSIYAGQTAGRGVGSDTVQKMSMSNLIDQAGLPSWIGALAPLRSAGGMARTVGDIIYSKNDETIRHLLADTLKDPARAADAMRAAGVTPSMLSQYLQRASMLSPTPAAAAVVGGNQ